MVTRGTSYLHKLGELLGAVSDQEIRRLIGTMQERWLSAQEAVFVAGEQTDCIYFVVQGCITLSVAGRNGRAITLDLLRAGDILGETALVENGTRRLSARALEPSTLVGLQRDDFEVLMRQHHAFASAVTKLLAQRILVQQQLVQRLASQSVASRLAQFLLDQLDRQPGNPVLQLRLTHNQLAQLVGTSRETVSALMGRFAKLGLIAYDRASISVVNSTRLTACARGDLYVSAR